MFNWKKVKENKYKNVKTVIDGVEFDSRKEANHYVYLKALQAANKISGLELQPRYELQPGFRGPDGRWIKPVTYVADFRYKNPITGQVVIVDVKSKITEQNPVYRLKRKLFQYKYPDVVFQEVM